jgi:putative SOS response-associated peptidase YedK
MYNLTGPAPDLEPRCNIAPTDPIDVAIRGGHVVKMRWGLIPAWWSLKS